MFRNWRRNRPRVKLFFLVKEVNDRACRLYRMFLTPPLVMRCSTGAMLRLIRFVLPKRPRWLYRRTMILPMNLTRVGVGSLYTAFRNRLHIVALQVAVRVRRLVIPRLSFVPKLYVGLLVAPLILTFRMRCPPLRSARRKLVRHRIRLLRRFCRSTLKSR